MTSFAAALFSLKVSSKTKCLLSESGGSGVDDAIIASLQGLAAGTLLYVAMFEILSRERANQVL